MTVPNRPTSGAPIETTWGDVVHDSIAAQDLQAGTVSITLNGTGAATATVTFPRPFASPPVVVATAYSNGVSGSPVPILGTPTATTVLVLVIPNAGGNLPASGSCVVAWHAYGPRA